MPYPKDILITCPACGKKEYAYWEEPHLDVMGTFYFGEPDIDAFLQTGNMVFDKKNSWFAKHQSAWKVLCGEPIKIDYEKMPMQMQGWLIKNPRVFIQTVLDLYWFKFYDDCEAQDPPIKKEDISARLYNLPDDIMITIPEIPLKKNRNKLSKVECMIIASKMPKMEFVKYAYLCLSCNGLSLYDSQNPVRCKACKEKTTLVFEEEMSESIDTQKIIIQESRLSQIANPFRTQLILRGNTIDNFDPQRRKYVAGNEARITLIPKIVINNKNGNKGKVECQPEVVDIDIIKKSFEELVDIPQEIIEKIKNLHKASENPVCQLMENDGKDVIVAGDLLQSFCPEIYGLWTLKLALLLQLYSGSKESEIKRDNIHIILIGDPSTAKTSLMKYQSTVSPKGLYAVASSSSKAGLTATVYKSEDGDWTLEAGALILANRGVCCIDEFGQMKSEDTYALYEAMEQQTVTIHKANVHATLPAKTAILAGMNPKFGRLSIHEPLISQIEISPPLFERFDLKFLLRDKPNKELDRMIADRIFDREEGKIDTIYDKEFIKHHIAYARQRYNPTIPKKVRNKITEFYETLREKSHQKEGQSIITITPRELNTLIRLTQAIAKMNLRKKAKVADADMAIWLLRQSLNDLGMDVTSAGDILSFQFGATQNEILVLDKKTRLLKLIPFEPDLIDKKILFDRAEEKHMDLDWVENTLEKMKQQGLVFEPKPMQYGRIRQS